MQQEGILQFCQHQEEGGTDILPLDKHNSSGADLL